MEEVVEEENLDIQERKKFYEELREQRIVERLQNRGRKETNISNEQ